MGTQTSVAWYILVFWFIPTCRNTSAKWVFFVRIANYWNYPTFGSENVSNPNSGDGKMLLATFMRNITRAPCRVFLHQVTTNIKVKQHCKVLQRSFHNFTEVPLSSITKLQLNLAVSLFVDYCKFWNGYNGRQFLVKSLDPDLDPEFNHSPTWTSHGSGGGSWMGCFGGSLTMV